ncbi:MAG: hypothetical protein FWD22_01725 [Treponema sp.]|nr:hypothetical protein [Treponema sp.]
MKKIIFLLIIVTLVISCPLGDSSKTGTLVIRLPGSSDARSGVGISNDFANTLKFNINFNGPIEKDMEVHNAGDTVSISLAEGNWEITLTALNAVGFPVGENTIKVTIIAGRTSSVPITLPINTNWKEIVHFEITNVENSKLLEIINIDENDGEVRIMVPRGTDKSSLNVSVIYTGAFINHVMSAPVNFSDDKEFIVTAGNGDERKYWVTLIMPDAFYVTNEYEMQMVGRGDANLEPYKLWTLDEQYELVADLNLAGINWEPIGDAQNRFTGKFYGNGKVISNLSITNSGNNQGLFGYIGTDGEVVNLGLVDVNIVVTGQYVGGIAGYNFGEIFNCFVTGNISGMNAVGGVVGDNSFKIENCFSEANIKGYRNLGGVIGANQTTGNVKNCYATGDIDYNSVGTGMAQSYGGVAGYNGGTIEFCYATGTVKDGPLNVGGIVGHNETGTVRNCVALNPAITGPASINRVIGSGVNGLSGLYARSDMTVNDESIAGNTTSNPAGSNISNVNWNTATWWTEQGGGAPRWNLSTWNNTNIWNIVNGSLPTLKNMPGDTAQTPVVK